MTTLIKPEKINHLHYFNEETIKDYMYETYTAKWEFIRYNCDWEDDVQLFNEILEDFDDQIQEAEIAEFIEMKSWDPEYLAMALRREWRKQSILRLEIKKIKEAVNNVRY
jgi:hypothetical protein